MIRIHIFLTVLLGISLSSNAIAQTFKPQPSPLGISGTTFVYSSERMQAQTMRFGDLEGAAKTASILGESASSFGFAERSPEARFFLAGTLYAESLAFTRIGDAAAAGSRVKVLRETLKLAATFPAALDAYLQRVSEKLDTSNVDGAAALELLGLAQPFLEEFSASQSQDKGFLFRTGAWLTDMALAASGNNTIALRQKYRIEATLSELKRMDAPKGVIESLEEIRKIAVGKDLDARHGKRVVELVKRIQGLLG